MLPVSRLAGITGIAPLLFSFQALNWVKIKSPGNIQYKSSALLSIYTRRIPLRDPCVSPAHPGVLEYIHLSR